MKTCPKYTKVITLGSSMSENALIGNVLLQEKVDGSQFRFGKNEEGKLVMGSKSCRLEPHFDEHGQMQNIQKLFVPAVQTVLRISKTKFWELVRPDTYYFAETLCKPKHNVLKYKNVPRNNIVLFDAMIKGRWISRKELEAIAKTFEIDVIPELYRGFANVEKIKELLATPSYLGGEIVEGVVIKNYSQLITLRGHIFPLFTKYVREAFKERHTADWKIKRPKDCVQSYIQGFKSEARWDKALIHLKEKGLLETHPKDIGKLIKEVHADIKEEEAENIKTFLYKKFIGEIIRVSTKGLPEWYKNKLLENLNENKEEGTPIEEDMEFRTQYLDEGEHL